MPVLSDGSRGPHQREQQEKQARDLEPENVRHPANIAGRDPARVIEGPDDTILAGSSSRYSQECAALPVKTTR